MTAINTALADADHHSTKRQILGIIATEFSPNLLSAFLPGVNVYQIKAARAHVYRKGNIDEKILKMKCFIQGHWTFFKQNLFLLLKLI